MTVDRIMPLLERHDGALLCPCCGLEGFRVAAEVGNPKRIILACPNRKDPCAFYAILTELRIKDNAALAGGVA
jgi:hypothetical protein